MTQKPYLLFDAGGVLVFPNFKLLAEIGKRVGIETSPQEIAAQHAQLFYAFDQQVARQQQLPSINYFLDLFKQVTEETAKAQAAQQLALKAAQKQHLWATTQPWVGQSLQKLKEQGHQMGVISNSEGMVEQILESLDLRKYFEIVIDSFIVGVEKPDARIFEIALERLGWNRAETIYIGDIFYVDVWGANQAGLGAIHLDKMGLYKDWDGVHIPSVKALPALFANSNGNMQDLNLFPARGFTIN